MSLMATEEEDNMFHSWKETKDRDFTYSRIKYKLKSVLDERINLAADTLNRNENTITHYRRSLKGLHDDCAKQRRIISTEQKHIKESIESISNELDMLIKNEKVDDVHIHDHIIHVFTKPLYMYDLHGNRYYLGKCNFKIDLFDSHVVFDNDNRRHGFWNQDDVHPHISGLGEPCWGTIDSTIIELCSEYQIYAIALMCINFLEQANTEDSAGEFVISWDKVDEEGQVIAIGGSYGLPNHYHCECCENWRHDDDQYTVYSEIGHEDDSPYPSGEHYVCSSCREDNYSYNDEVEAYIYKD